MPPLSFSFFPFFSARNELALGEGRNYMYFMDGNVIACSGYVNAVSNFGWVIANPL